MTLDQLQSLAKQVSDQQWAIAQERLKAMVEVRAILRPDQLDQAVQLKDRLRTLRQEMHSLWRNPQ